MIKRALACLLLLVLAPAANAAWNAHYDLDALPNVPDGFKVMFIGKEPLLMHEVCMCFDEKGRIFTGGGAQFRWPKPETPKDQIKILIDKDGDGVMDEVKIFAEGFNCIQALAWHGKDLWVCHAPDITICRDTDGDDVADEFIDVYTGLGPLRHGCHGFNWGPDGKLYMSQGNNTCQKTAPKPWRDLMHVESDEPDIQPLRKYSKADWKSHYLAPHNDESEGGILRCDADGKNLEIWARGMRNPWDIAFDSGFNWVSGDNDDGPEHDRVFSPFYGSHWGKRHAWSYNWTGEGNPCTCKVSTMFENASGSAVGTVFYMSEQFPKEYQNSFFMGDSDGEKVYFFKPKWDGAFMNVKLETLASTPKIGAGSLFCPTDVEVGPDGALYVVGWGSSYGSNKAPYYKGDENVKVNEGRIFKIWYDKNPLIAKEKWNPAKRAKPYEQWSFAELMDDMGHQIPVWRVNAQLEMVKRGKAIQAELIAALNSGKLSEAQETWSLWALGRMDVSDTATSKLMEPFLTAAGLNQRIQALRVLQFRNAHEFAPAIGKLTVDKEPRVRFEAALALWHMGAKDQIAALKTAAGAETDRVAFYAQWRGLAELAKPDELKSVLKDEKAGTRRAALLALLETKSLNPTEVLEVFSDKDKETRQIAILWLTKLGKDLPAEQLAKLLDDADADTRGAALLCLSRTKLNGDVYKKLVAFHAKAQGEERAMAVKALASDSNALDILWGELESKEELVRQAAIDGLSSHEKELPKFVWGKLEGATGPQRDGAFMALAGMKKLEWIPDAAKVKALGQSLSGNDVAARKAAIMVLQKAKGLAKSPEAKTAAVLAQKAADDPDKDVKEGGQKLAKDLGVKLAERHIEGTQIEQAVPLITQGDPKRGHDIFFRPNAPGCYNCHQLEKQGTAIGPDLSDIGLRADGRNICESILDPNKVIIEGFQPTLIKTKDNKVISGIIKEESDEVVVIAEIGRRTDVPKTSIQSRKSLNVSFMPDNFGELLKPQDVADVISFLLTQKTPKAAPTKKGGD